jgi:acyl-CoA synthetase (AMP-forming)/AMP-acid ligase II
MRRVEEFLTEQVAIRGAEPALSDSIGTQWSFDEFDRASDDVATLLRDAGVQPNDRVLMLSENCAAAVATVFGTWKAGAVIIPVNARQSPAEIKRIIDHATPAAILMTTCASSDAVKHSDAMGGKEVTGAFGSLHLATPIASNPDADLGDVAVLLYTTGTTGDPKGVMLTHDNVRFGGKASAKLRGISAGNVVYGVLPLTHVFGLCSVMTASCCAGAHVRLEARFSAEKLYTALTTGVHFLSAVPQMHALLMQYTKEKGLTQLGSETLRYVSSGAAPLDPAWKRKAEAFYGVAIQNGYGMTETTAGTSATSNPLGSSDISVGPPLPRVEIKIDDTVAGSSPGCGEVLTRGAHIMKGYYKNPAETAKAIDAEGWLRTGDLGTIDQQGHLHILGRSKELIIHGGFNVYPPEVEAAINDHPQVIQTAVVGRRKDGDEEVLAFVQIAEGDTLDPETLRAFVKERLTGYKRPSQFIIGTALPAAPTGKILKHKLIETFKNELA